ncbi:terminase large subunit [Pseudochrobactrum saccharolyticum]|uniref:terminase large subunit n=1 Tax=Pseudochrobactrum saccharolyticum TaxID=354352 RepID=UPI00275E413C|nr:terminase TerL endonuclease subunit [Pseudochrobactrum saccharolyticum]MDP8251483.1 terminase large subunit [Pseudochrobactrum saccharolyticum]
MSKSAFPHWIYDGSEIPDPFGYGQDAVDFIRLLKHPKSSAPKNAFQLFEPFERITRRIYGPCHDDGRRIVKKVFMMFGRGNRKTSHAAAWSALHLFGPETKKYGQVIFAASDRDQAGIGFTELAGIVDETRYIKAIANVYNSPTSRKRIINTKEKAVLEAVSSDAKSKFGTTPNFIFMDELHKWKGRDLWEALNSGMRKTDDPLMVICTNAGRGQDTVAYELYDYARKVATGEHYDPTFLPILFQAEADDDWEDEATWLKGNPGLPYGFPSLEGMRDDVRMAKISPPARYEFLQLGLNIWQAASRDPLFDMAVYDQGHDWNFDLAELETLPCYLGVDLSRSGDLTALVAAFRHEDGRVSVHPWFYLPSEGLAEKAKVEKVPYLQWRDDGFLNVIDGSVIEPDIIADQIINICGTYNVQEVIFDPSLAGSIMAKLINAGINVLQHPQTPKNMHAPICDLERVVNGKRIRHGAHPILRNHFDNVVVKRATNVGELTTMHKGTRHSNHIDGAIASALAVSRAATNDNQRSIFDLAPDEFDEFFAKVA